MTYETEILSESVFRQKARGKKTFNQLYQDQGWKAGASSWGTPELFAARAISMPERALMTPLSEFYPDDLDFNTVDSNIASFYVGFENMDELAWQSELELVQANDSDSLGGIWAALGALLRREKFALGIYGPNQSPTGPSMSPARQTAIQAHETVQNIRLQALRRQPQGSTGSRAEEISGPLVEDGTVRLLSSVVRHILNYQQDATTVRLSSWRDQRVTYGYKGGTRAISAIDDGGIEMWLPGNRNLQQVALFEAKRILRNVNGNLHVSDEVLAQMVGQAIALQRSDSHYIAACQNM